MRTAAARTLRTQADLEGRLFVTVTELAALMQLTPGRSGAASKTGRSHRYGSGARHGYPYRRSGLSSGLSTRRPPKA